MFHRRCPSIASWVGLVVRFVVAVSRPKSRRRGKKGGRGQESQVHGDVQKSQMRLTEMSFKKPHPNRWVKWRLRYEKAILRFLGNSLSNKWWRLSV